MPRVNEIFIKAKEQLRNMTGDAVEILKKSIDKVAFNVDENMTAIENVGDKTEKAIKEQEGAILKGLEGVKNAVDNQEVAESVNIKNPEAITGDLKKGLQGIIEALKTELKNFDKNIVVKNDFSNFASLFKTSQDKKSIIEALKKIEDKLGDEKEEDVDYTMILSDIAKSVEDKEAVNILKEILKKEFNVLLPEVYPVDLDPNLIENDRVKTVLPDDQVLKMSKTISDGNNTKPIIDVMQDGTQKTQITDGTSDVAVQTMDNGDNLDGLVGIVTASGMYGRVDNSALKAVRLDGVTDALCILESEHYKVHEGSHYFMDNYDSFTNGEVKDFTVVTPDTAKWTHFTFIIEGTGATSLEIFEGATVDTPGTAITIINNNRNSANTSNLTIREDDTFTDDGTSISRQSTGALNTTGQISCYREIILKQNTTYVFRLTNETALSNTINWSVNWYEHTNNN